MKKFLLTAMCVAAAGMTYASLPAHGTMTENSPSVNLDFKKAKQSQKVSKITEAPATEWGEWTEMATSTLEFPDEEFIYQGVNPDVATYYRVAVNEEGHAQYRFDDVFFSNISEEKTSLYVDVYDGDMGPQVTVYPQALPAIDLGPELSEICPGPYYICDMATGYDMEYYRIMNKYTPVPMNISILAMVYDGSMNDLEGMLAMGTINIKTNAKPAFSIPSAYVLGGDMGMGLLKVEKDDSVWNIKYALDKGDAEKMDFETYESSNIINRIMADDESLVIMYYMAGDLMVTPMDGPGKYTLGAVAYDENDQVVGSATCTVYNMPTESWNWNSLGNAKVSEDFLRDVFGMNIYEAGIEANGPAEYEVAVEESNSTPGLYRLVNLYGPSHPYAAIFEYLNEFPVYTYIDCTSDAGCYIYNMPTGFVVKGDTSGEILIGSEPSTYLSMGAPMDMVAAELSYCFGSKKENVITFKAEQVDLYVPVFAEYFGDGWITGDFCTDNDFVIQLPEGTGVESASVAEKAEYYDLNGVRVVNPAKGGIYIMRKGGKVEKVVK